jgi:hypothetical protein
VWYHHSANQIIIVVASTPGLSIDCCFLLFGSRVRHDAPGALRGLFFLVDMLLPVVHSAVTSPSVAFLLVAIVLVSCCVSSITVGWFGRSLDLHGAYEFVSNSKIHSCGAAGHTGLLVNFSCSIRLVLFTLVLWRRLTPIVRSAWRLTPVVLVLLFDRSLLITVETHSCDSYCR